MFMDIIADIEFTVLIFIKIATLLFLIFYLIFAGVVIKQTKIMTETIQVGFENPIKALSFIHFIFALFILFLVVIVL